jgi:putative flavoprotein involved in K+ transport
MSSIGYPDFEETVIVGGGQAGLTLGYYLAQRGRPFVILDQNERVGDAWRQRWDSLRLFTPASFCRLPGMKLPESAGPYPSKDAMADYLESYAERFGLPVRNGVKVDRLSKRDGRLVVSAGTERLEATNVVVATGAHRIPARPDFASELDRRIVQLHSSEYKNPSQVQEGDVLVVGAGNSGAEIAVELAAEHRCLLAGPDVGQIPVPYDSRRGRMGFRVFRFFMHHVVKLSNPIGRRIAPHHTQAPLVRTRTPDILAAGVERVPRVTGVDRGRPVLEDGRVADVANVVWCTGFRTDFGWIDLPVFDEQGQPRHRRGVVESEPGLHFLGLVFQYSASSDVLPSRGRDAGYIAKHIASRQGEALAAELRPGRVAA